MDQNELRKKTIAKLQELFQLDQPDLDFGFYRVMHVKANEISKFIERDLLKTIQTAFDTVSAEKASGELESVRASVVSTLGEDALDSAGALKPEYQSTPVGRKYLKAYQNAGSSKAKLIGADQVYTHLYRFFSRYYDSGDFVSMRYHARETSSVAKPYAIPYGGEEVMLYWANADQYYIKTTENFRDFTFDPAAAPEIQNLPEDQRNLILGTVTPGQYKVHFTIVDADQGEHGNIKSADDSKREFFLANDPICYENGELVVRFEYRTPGDGDQISEAREKQLQERFGFSKKSNLGLYNAAAEILDALATDASVPEPYSVLLNVSAPLESVKKRPLLVKYLYRYTAANKSDYFIHKNLRAFLRRELDFYIKNEIMNLDDVETADASVVENMLALIKVFRKIAGKLIDFLGQLEDFQKKLWLKKKFVVECNYCITLDRIRSAVLSDESVDSSQTRQANLDGLLSEIFSNERQVAEWERLGFDVSGLPTGNVKLGWGGGMRASNQQLALDEMESAARDPNDYLMVDTQFFTPEFKKRLLSFIPDFDAQCDGLLIHSENFQALNLLQERYREQVKCIYIDPPYNAASSEILYKNTFKHSSWLSLMNDRLLESRPLLTPDGLITVAIDDYELPKLWELMNNTFGYDNHLGTICIRINPKGRMTARKVSAVHEYTIVFGNSDSSYVKKLPVDPSEKTHNYKQDENGNWYLPNNLRKQGVDSEGEKGDGTLANRYYPIYYDPQTGQVSTRKVLPIVIYPIDSSGNKRIWRRGEEVIDELYEKGDLWVQKIKNEYQVYYKFYGGLDGKMVQSIWTEAEYSASDYGTKILDNMLGRRELFPYPKAPMAVAQNILAMTNDPNALILDFFAGSGTTYYSIINLNREDKGRRKCILIEMGNYFEPVTKTRIEKVVYSPDWKDGKPTSFDKGVSHCFKYLRLESYEDTLNNLELPESDPIASNSSLPSSLREDYMLRYLLETESRDSLLDLRMFNDPFGEYKLNIKRPGSEASESTPVDLIETFNYLIGLRVTQYYMPLRYSAKFKRAVDPELPGEEGSRRLVLDGKPKRDDNGKWRFECIEGVVPAHPLNPNNGQTKRVLIIWRNLTGDLERDNAVLDWLADDIGFNDKVPEYDIVYVNGCNNLGADRKETDSYQVRLIEEEFFKKMWG